MTQTNPSKLLIYTDGGARGNPGPAAVGVVIYHQEQIIAEISHYIGTCTNNEAEYRAVLAALDWLKKSSLKVSELCFYLDSLLVVQQINGVYKITKPHLQRFHNQIKTELANTSYSFNHIPRSQNKIADSLVNQALDNHT